MTQPLMIGRKPAQGRWLRLTGALSLALVCCLIALTPVGVTLELHHALGAEDADGHEHSDTDLCQWIQHHIGTSVLTGVPDAVSFGLIARQDSQFYDLYSPTRFSQAGPPRGPPDLSLRA